MAKRKPVNYGEGECGYRFCNLPVKKFLKKKEDQKFCCSNHRTAEWDLQNPRIKKKEDAKKQEPLPLPLGLPQGTVKHGLPLFPPIGSFNVSGINKKKSKRTFHYTRIDRENKRGEILRSTLELLLKVNPTTFEINQHTGSTRGGSDISEIRHNGFDVVCKKVGTSENGITVSRFELTEEGKEKAVRFFQERA